ncbi:4-hydroxythreonine-4-phosphate dehydrogenase PdxA [Nonomuraea sp. 3-1Str]|uniref:4-hydroxythreonine-4-phosphate dehydrogenase PdxA n=1 Tax=Nonomuraea sp. 3-1Str TaxID=2929801 RepID=UPI00285BDADA|nr:4-hydroxythreonine-4-phosphate dehydrogenase PdxA [Nonomuraea sp. 3-1Str]MDR8409457.1 4-hydroxythreonine-4-phosphate dehydrogenase PdxA [Nonomuraea sp. 3-1Str]
MGDPAGIGPEIALKLVADRRCDVPVLIIGDAGVLTRARASSGLDVPIRTVVSAQDCADATGVAQVLAETSLPHDLPWGRVDGRAGEAAYRYVAKGVELARDDQIAALVTAPINKEALRLGGYSYPGHTEILAELSGADEYAMMMANDELRVVLVTIHHALRDAIDSITPEAVRRAIRLTHDALCRAGITAPRIAVAGLNPHAGENGLMGREDLDIIAPAVQRARVAGIDASGPWPADTVFLRARTGEFDAVVAQYHDQGLIPVKYLGLERGVNITIGLPFVRTSVDHGTAFDIAGKGVASHASLLTALDHARTLAGLR